MEVITRVIPPEEEGSTVRHILRAKLHFSSHAISRLTRAENGILVNGAHARTTYILHTGDILAVESGDHRPPKVEVIPGDWPLPVVWEDGHLLVVDKPAGMLIHPSRSRFDGTLANYVLGYYQKTGQKCAFHPVTRLDRDTFGIVLLSKNSHIHALMQASDVEKIYHALVLGHWEPDSGTIDAPIARRPLPSLLREIRADGKPSVTEYRVLERCDSYTKLALRPVTGRTHQLRLHCAHMGHPILGDPQYGNEASAFGLPHQMLCAKSLQFRHPITGEELLLESRMDAALEKI